MPRKSSSALNVLRSVASEHEYTEWRRATDTPQRYVVDIDQVEFRGETPVALIDLKAWPHYETDGYWKTVEDGSWNYAGKCYRNLSQVLGCGAFYVFSNVANNRVRVLNLGDMQWRDFDCREYADWLRSL